MDDVLLWAARLVLLLALLPAFFTLWYLTGADDESRNVVAPLLGFAVMGSAVWALVLALRDDPPVDARTLAVAAAPGVLAVVAWPFSGTRATGRPPARDLVESLVVFTPAPVLLLLSRWAAG